MPFWFFLFGRGDKSLLGRSLGASSFLDLLTHYHQEIFDLGGRRKSLGKIPGEKPQFFTFFQPARTPELRAQVRLLGHATY